jgi:amino acid transporter
MIAWVVIAICSIRFHSAVKAQNSSILSGKYAYRAWLYPAGPIFLGGTAFLVLVGLFAVSVWPINGAKSSAYDFFATYLGVPIVLVSIIGYKIVFKTKIRRASEIDLVSDYAPITEENSRFLDNYYSQPMWRRVWSYVSTSDNF